MNEKQLNSIARPVESVDELICKVDDEYTVWHKHAIINRNIEYTNNTNKEIPINIESWTFTYPFMCYDFIIFINNEQVKYEEAREKYTVVVKNIIYTEIKLSPGNSAKIRITYKWKNFIDFLSNLTLFIDHQDAADYRLKFTNYSIKLKPHIITINNKGTEYGKDFISDDNHLFFFPIKISQNSQISIHIFSISTPIQLPVLSYYVGEINNDKFFNNNIIILIQHLLSDSIHLVNSFVKCGVEKDSIFIIGIPYSTKDQTVEYLKLENFRNVKIPIEYPFKDLVIETIKETIKYSKEKNKKIIIVEDGGYAVPILHNQFMHDCGCFLGAVEQTTNGIWEDKDIYDKDRINYCIPILNVAESKLKKKLECPLIANAIIRNLELLFSREYIGIQNKQIALIGYGDIGSILAEHLKNSCKKLKIFDTRKNQREKAEKKGHYVTTNHIEAIKNSDIIIESSGREWGGTNEILAFKHGSYYLSSSSKRKGIIYNEFKNLIKRDSKILLPGIGTRFTLNNGNSVTLLADGFPINFFIGESVPDNSIDFILTLLFCCAVEIQRHSNDFKKSIIDLNSRNKLVDFIKLQNVIENLNKQLP